MQFLTLLCSKFSIIVIWTILFTIGSSFPIPDEFRKIKINNKDFEIDFPSKNLNIKTTDNILKTISHSKTTDLMITDKDEAIKEVEIAKQHSIGKMHLKSQSKNSTQELDKNLNSSKHKISIPGKISHPKNDSPKNVKVALKDNTKYLKREPKGEVSNQNSSIKSNTTNGNHKTTAALSSGSMAEESKTTTTKVSSESFTNTQKSIVETTLSISKVVTSLENFSHTTITPNFGRNETLKMESNTSDFTSTMKLPISPMATTVEGPKLPNLTSLPAQSVASPLGINTTQTNTSQHNESIAKPNSKETSNSSNDVTKDGGQKTHMPLAFGNRSMTVQLNSLFLSLRGNDVSFNVSYDVNSKNETGVVDVMTNSSTTLNQKSTQTTGYDFIIFPRR